MKKTSTLLILVIWICTFVNQATAQPLNCGGTDISKIFFLGPDSIYRYDPTLPISITNPSGVIPVNSINNGLTISSNLNGGALSPTFYTVNSNNEYEYWDGTAWINTTHTTGNAAAVNIGGGVGAIYNYVGFNTSVYKYTGVGTGVFLNTLQGDGPYDLATDASDNYFFLRASVSPGYIYKYSPLGILLDSITVTGHPISSAGGGFAYIGNTIMASFSGSDVWLGTIAAGAVTLASVGNVTFTISDVAQCPSGLDAKINVPDTTCGDLCITPTNGSTGNIATYQWTFAGGTPGFSTAFNPGQICFTTNGAHTISLIITDALGVKDTATKVIYVSSAKTIITSPDRITCVRKQPYQLLATGSLTYTWAPAGTLSCANCSSPFASPIITTSYLATGTDIIGCKTRDTVTITVVPLIASWLIADDSICISQGLSAGSTSTGASLSYVWQYGDGTPNTTAQSVFPPHFYANSGNYILQLLLSDTLGCKDTLRDTIYVENIGFANFSILDDSLCVGEQLNIKDTFNALPKTYSWNFGDTYILDTVRNPIHTYTQELLNGIVTLIADYAECPDIIITKPIHIFDLPTVDLGADKSICPGLNASYILQNLATGSGNYLWNTGENTGSISVSDAGNYWLQLSKNGCVGADSLFVTRDCYLDIPNSFTPDEDGRNDYFIPMEILSAGVTTFSMDIFNRWGEKIFTTTNIASRGWDGKYGGMYQPTGTYVYQISVVFKNAERKTYTGNVTLLR
jgi:gliding motility-associated-like protein